MFLFQLEKIDSKLSLSTPEMVMFLVRKLFAIARGSRIINTYFEFGNIFGNDKRFICRRTNGSKKKIIGELLLKDLPLLHICGAARSCSTMTLRTNSATSVSYIAVLKPESAIR